MPQRLRKSRKAYQCTYCENKISVGENYFYITITPWDHPNNDGFDVWRVHEMCLEAGNEFYYDEYEGGIFPWDFDFTEFIKFRDEYNAR